MNELGYQENEQLIEKMNTKMKAWDEGPRDLINEQTNEWMNEGMNEWMNALVNEWRC